MLTICESIDLAAQNGPSVSNQTIAPKELERLGPSSDQMDNAPVLQLFDNHLLKRREDSSGNDQFLGNADQSPKTQRVRAELLALFPPENEARKMLSRSLELWCGWDKVVPGLYEALASPNKGRNHPVAPADVANILLCLTISARQHAPDYISRAIEPPIDADEFSTTCTEAISRLIVRDDDYAATLPGIECQMLLSKYHLSEGQLRKAWLVNRRAIDLAHLAGMHLSTRNHSSSDTLFERRLKVWCALASADRSISLILGLPYGVAENYFLPQAEKQIEITESATERYMLRMGIITGHMIDRNQNPSIMSLETTLQLDRDLMETSHEIPSGWHGPEPDLHGEPVEAKERIPLQFMPKVMRTLLHMPFMLQHPQDPRYRYSYQTAIQSARESLAIYKVLRSGSIPYAYTCKMSDFMAFTMGMLLVVHLHGYSDDKSRYSKKQNASDWELLRELIVILRKASTENGGSVAAESANVLGSIFANRNKKRKFRSGLSSCRITIPYFGSITVVPTNKAMQYEDKEKECDTPRVWPSHDEVSARPSHQIYTPPTSDLDGTSNIVGSNESSENTPGRYISENSFASQMAQSMEEYQFTVDPPGSVEFNPFGAFLDESGRQTLSSFDFDLDLDQGWNLSWFDHTVLPE